MDNQENVTLTNLGEGAALELFNYELERVLENCADINTPHKKARSITLTVEFYPNEERDKADIKIQVKASLAQAKSYPTSAFICKTEHGFCAIESRKPKQVSIFDKTPHDNVRPINERG